MSSILDALRKLEEQKKARTRRPVDVTAGIVRTAPSPKSLPVRPWQIGASLAVVAGASVLVTLLMVRGREPSPPPSTTAQITVSPAVKPAVPQQQAGAVALPAPPPKVLPASPAPSARTAAPNPSPRALPAPAAASIPTPAVHPDRLPVEPAPTIEAPRPPSPPPPRPPEHRVTGIGWQKDAAARYAVINGTPVSEGGSVDGAKVEEIMPDKVRLGIDGRTVVIELGK